MLRPILLETKRACNQAWDPGRPIRGVGGVGVAVGIDGGVFEVTRSGAAQAVLLAAQDRGGCSADGRFTWERQLVSGVEGRERTIALPPSKCTRVPGSEVRVKLTALSRWAHT